MKERWFKYTLILLWITLTGCLLTMRLSLPVEQILIDDAAQYSSVAENIVDHGFYSIDGVTPFTFREPGYSTFMAIVYLLFGNQNLFALLIIQSLLHLGASLVFIQQIRSTFSERVAKIVTVFLLLSPAVFHISLSPLRESVVLSSFLVLGTAWMRLLEKPTYRKSIVMGMSLTAMIMTYFIYVFLPLIIALLTLRQRGARRMIVPIVVIPFVTAMLWSYRNVMQVQSFSVTDSHISASLLFSKAEQARNFTIIDPFRCIWDEYITHNIESMSPFCRIKDVPYDRRTERHILQESFSALLRSPLTIVMMIAGAIELHLPYVNGWGRAYNILETIMTVILYAGIIIGLPYSLQRKTIFFWLAIAYATIMFSFVLAYPRYHLTIYSAYATLSGIGYARWGIDKKRLKDSK